MLCVVDEECRGEKLSFSVCLEVGNRLPSNKTSNKFPGEGDGLHVEMNNT